MKEMLPKNASGLKLQLGPSNRMGCTIPTDKVKLLLLFRVLSEDDQTGLVNAVNIRKFHIYAAFRCSPLSGVYLEW